MAKYFRFPWATTGDRADIPDETQNSGAVSYNEGYGASYSRNPATDPSARRIERQMYNQALFDITSTLQEYYQRGTPEFITSANNGGAPFNYPIYSRVLFNNRIYESLINNNNTQPTNTTNWRLVDFAGLDARYITTATAGTSFLRKSSNLSDLTNNALARTNLGGVPTQSEADARYLLESSNLSDLTNSASARNNLGLRSAATRGTGTTTGTVPLLGPLLGNISGNSATVTRNGTNANGNFRIYSDGFMMQWSNGSTITGTGGATFNFPIRFFSEPQVIPWVVNGSSPGYTSVDNVNTSTARVFANIDSGVRIIAIGF